MIFDASRRPRLTTAVLGVAHLLVDLTSISTLYTATASGLFPAVWVAVLILSYDYIAFASQLFLGYALDRLGLSGKAAALGAAITAAGAWLVVPAPLAAVLVVAAGNALFHVGGGAICLNLERGRARWAGLFVAPGAIGLALGKLLGGTALFLPWALTALLLPFMVIGFSLLPPQGARGQALPPVKGFGLIMATLLITVVVRSLVGFSVSFPWAAGWQQALLLTAAIFAGKALGGVLGDRLGWRNVTVAGLLLSAPLLALGAGTPALALAGLTCFNLTMAITLAGAAWLLPGHEGFAFGLTTTAIIVGLTPTALPAWKPFLGSPAALAAFIVLSAAALWVALGRLERHVRKEQEVPLC